MTTTLTRGVNPGGKTTGRKLLRLITAFIIFVVVISTVMIFYITARIKEDRLTSLMTAKSVNSAEIVIEFFEPVTTVLKTMYNWGNAERLDLGKSEQLNLTLIPLLDNKSLSRITGLAIADDTGSAYYLLRENGKWVTRLSSPVEEEKEASFQSIENNEVQKEWVEKTDFDPRKRAWFKNVVQDGIDEGDILWTKPYMFYMLEQPGVTASVKCYLKKNEKSFLVIACDLLLKDLSSAFKNVLAGHKGSLFLMAENGRVNDLTPIVYYDESMKIEPVLPGTDISKTVRATFFRKMKEGITEKHTVFQFVNGTKKWWGSISPAPTDTGIAHLCIAVSEEQLTRDFEKGKYGLFIISFVVIVLGAFILLWVAGNYFRKLEENSHEAGFVAGTEEEVLLLIDQGESEKLEFKSTLRLNLKTEKKGKEIELASLKTIAAFMNSDGGTLLVGVDDDGHVLGLEADGFENDDKALLHFNNLFSQHIGLEFSGYVSFDLKVVKDKSIFVIDSRRSEEPVFLKNKGDEEFYVRVGPGSRKLSTSEVLEYLKTRQ